MAAVVILKNHINRDIKGLTDLREIWHDYPKWVHSAPTPTPTFRSPTQAPAQKNVCSSVIFAFYMLNIRHISTSGLFDLLT